MKFSPRPYQKKAVEAVISRYNNGLNKMLLHLPTGAGKTVIATLIIEKLINPSDIGKILFVAHREEILGQTWQTISSHLPSANV
ncbi:MAG: DEAD/DEAH box helicase family protein [Deltaproteobacteria bacterium]|nr:DEAD/DEAH box helicase family protein [Deltaproteobacteria bacterium]